MTDNIDQFRHGFREEARELLVELESVLLELNEQPGNEGLIGRAFRALHTIKGSGAMFGFDALAAFAHKLENAFDEVRKGRLAVTPELVDLTLSALDQIRAMVEEGDGASAVDPQACEEILAPSARAHRRSGGGGGSRSRQKPAGRRTAWGHRSRRRLAQSTSGGSGSRRGRI